MEWSSQQRKAMQKVRRFWFAHHRTPSQEMRHYFVHSLLRELEKDGCTPQRLSQWTMIHPKLEKKEKLRSYPIMDVITDFLLDVPQAHEKDEEYPITNAEVELERDRARFKNELTLIDADSEPEKSADWPAETVPHSASEYVISADTNPVEDEVCPDENLSDPEELTSAIIALKDDVEDAVYRYSDNDRDWNDSTTDKKRTPENVRKAVRLLDESRVKACAHCGQAFYAHDRRMKYCNLLNHPKQLEFSICQYESMKENARKYSENAYISTIYQKKIPLYSEGPFYLG
ncbi:hypothetical protein [Evansella clarkii]|uniref:hypothetical protein n=1 Tax=Evansella clarkii TaxID=79879 RepID=UPI000B445E2E|nr:hypothetical protein [Evansella clarkii]